MFAGDIHVQSASASGVRLVIFEDAEGFRQINFGFRVANGTRPKFPKMSVTPDLADLLQRLGGKGYGYFRLPFRAFQ